MPRTPNLNNVISRQPTDAQAFTLAWNEILTWTALPWQAMERGVFFWRRLFLILDFRARFGRLASQLKTVKELIYRRAPIEDSESASRSSLLPPRNPDGSCNHLDWRRGGNKWASYTVCKLCKNQFTYASRKVNPDAFAPNPTPRMPAPHLIQQPMEIPVSDIPGTNYAAWATYASLGTSEMLGPTQKTELEPCDVMTVSFGKHKGKTMSEVRKKYTGYARWIMEEHLTTHECDPRLALMSEYLLNWAEIVMVFTGVSAGLPSYTTNPETHAAAPSHGTVPTFPMATPTQTPRPWPAPPQSAASTTSTQSWDFVPASQGYGPAKGRTRSLEPDSEMAIIADQPDEIPNLANMSRSQVEELTLRLAEWNEQR